MVHDYADTVNICSGVHACTGISQFRGPIVSRPESFAGNVDVFLAEHFGNPKIYELDIKLRQVRDFISGLLATPNEHNVAGLNISVNCIFVGIHECIKQLANYVEGLIKANLLSGVFAGLDNVSKVKLAADQLHTDENIFAETLGVGSLFDAVGLYDSPMSKASRYHCTLLETVNSGPVSTMARPDCLDCNFLVGQMVIGLIYNSLSALTDFFKDFIMTVPYFV